MGRLLSVALRNLTAAPPDVHVDDGVQVSGNVNVLGGATDTSPHDLPQLHPVLLSPFGFGRKRRRPPR
jgi:hypothetical protein